MVRRRDLTCVAFALALLTPRRSSAEPREVALTYEAPVSCPSRAELQARVEALTRLAVFAEGPGAQRFEIHVDRRGKGFGGALRTDAGTRTVEAERCDDVVSALALVTAIAIDPRALTASASAPTPASAFPLSSASAPAPESAPAPTPESAPAPALPPIEPDRLLSASRQPLPVGRLDVSAGAEMRTAFSPMPLFGGNVAVGLRGRGPLAPAAYAGFAYDTGADTAARYALATAEVGACLERSLGAAFTVAPCLQLDVGQARTSGVDVASPADATRLWSDLSLLGRGRMSLSRTFSVEASVGPFLSLTRPTYVFEDPTIVVHQVPLLGFYAGVSASATLR
jgi:hypothetical protein